MTSFCARFPMLLRYGSILLTLARVHLLTGKFAGYGRADLAAAAIDGGFGTERNDDARPGGDGHTVKRRRHPLALSSPPMEDGERK